MSSIILVWRYIKGMRRKLLLTFVSVIVSYLIVQGIFLFTFSYQQTEVQRAINSIGGDIIIGFDTTNPSYEYINLVLDSLENYSSSVNQDIVEWDGVFVYSYDSDGHKLFLADNTLCNVLADEVISTEEVLITKPFAISVNTSEGSDLNLYGMNFTVSYLDYSQYSRVTSFTDSTVKALFNIDVLRNTSFTPYQFFEFYYIAKYDFSLLNDYRPSVVKETTQEFDSIITTNLDTLSGVSSGIGRITKLFDKLSIIEEETREKLVLYFLYSLPILAVCLYFYSLTLKSTKKWWQQDLLQLWQKGFSRKQTFALLLQIFIIFDLVLFFLFLALFVAESSILGLLVSAEYWLLIGFYALLFILSFLFQIRTTYLFCFPQTEKTSIVSSEQDDFQEVIKYTNTSPKVRKKYLIICGVFLIIGVLLLNFDKIIFWLHNNFHIDSFFILITYLGDRPFPTYTDFFYRVSGLVIVLISSVIIVLLLLTKFFQLSNKILVERGKNKEERKISLKIFRRSIFNHKTIGFLIFFLFFSTCLTWIFISSVLVEQQDNSIADLALNPKSLKSFGLDIADINNLTTRPEIELFTVIYRFNGFLKTNEGTLQLKILVIDPATFPLFLKSRFDTSLFEFHSSKNVFQTMLQQSNSSIIDFESYMSSSLFLNEQVTIVPFIEEQSYFLDMSIYDVSKYDIADPRGRLDPYVAISIQAFNFSLNITTASTIYLKFKDKNQISSYKEMLYDDYGITSISSAASTSTSANFENYLFFLQSVSFLVIFLISIPLIIDIFSSNLQSLAKLYSRGYSFNRIINRISSNLLLFWNTYALVGCLSAVSVLAFLKLTIPTLYPGQYYSIHFEAAPLILLTSTYLFFLLIQVAISVVLMRVSFYRNKILGQVILSDGEK